MFCRCCWCTAHGFALYHETPHENSMAELAAAQLSLQSSLQRWARSTAGWGLRRSTSQFLDFSAPAHHALLRATRRRPLSAARDIIRAAQAVRSVVHVYHFVSRVLHVVVHVFARASRKRCGESLANSKGKILAR